MTETNAGSPELVEMSWDPITRIVGSLGIYTKIDFATKKVVECYSTSSIFRGYSIFMLNKDPRDTHFINDLNYDSLDRIEFAMKLEEMFDLQVPDEEAEKIQTVGEAIDYVIKLLESLVGSDP